MNISIQMMWGFQDNLSRKVTVHLKNNAEVLLNDMRYMLGFTGDRQVDLEYGFHDLFIYCDRILLQYFGDALVPLLRIVPVEEEVGQRVSKSFVRPQYVPVRRKQFETIEVNIKRDTRICGIWVGKSVVNASISSESISVLLKMKKIHAPNPMFYEQYCVDQAMQKGGNLRAFHRARFQWGYGLGSIFKGLFRWAMPHFQQGAIYPFNFSSL